MKTEAIWLAPLKACVYDFSAVRAPRELHAPRRKQGFVLAGLPAPPCPAWPSPHGGLGGVYKMAPWLGFSAAVSQKALADCNSVSLTSTSVLLSGHQQGTLPPRPARTSQIQDLLSEGIPKKIGMSFPLAPITRIGDIHTKSLNSP